MAKFSPLLLFLGLLAVFADKAASAPHKHEEDESNYEDEYAGDSNDRFDDDQSEEQEYNGPPPVIYTKPEVLREMPGSNVVLPCNITNLDPNLAVMWLKGSTPLFSDSIRMTEDKRIERREDNSLEIHNLNSKDSGEYFCELSTPDKMHVMHTLHVYGKPKIVAVHPARIKLVRKGDPLTLKCDVEGYPPPTITWTKKGKRLPTGEESKRAISITFESVDRSHNGSYECLAENGYGEPAKETINVRVQYPPEVKIEKETVNTAEGYTSELTCTVHAEPRAKVFWFKDSLFLDYTDRISETKIGSHHTLRIKNTQESDFGTYTCFANNSIGRHQQVVELSGVPSKAQFISSSPKMQNGNTQILSWTVESNSPITEYKLMYRMKNTTDSKFNSPEVINPDGNVYTVTAEINDLGEGIYEAALISKNAYGWSSESEWQSFSGMDYQKTEPQAKTVVKEEASMEEPSGSGVGLRPNVLAALLIVSFVCFHV